MPGIGMAPPVSVAPPLAAASRLFQYCCCVSPGGVVASWLKAHSSPASATRRGWAVPARFREICGSKALTDRNASTSPVSTTSMISAITRATPRSSRVLAMMRFMAFLPTPSVGVTELHGIRHPHEDQPVIGAGRGGHFRSRLEQHDHGPDFGLVRGGGAGAVLILEHRPGAGVDTRDDHIILLDSARGVQDLAPEQGPDDGVLHSLARIEDAVAVQVVLEPQARRRRQPRARRVDDGREADTPRVESGP